MLKFGIASAPSSGQFQKQQTHGVTDVIPWMQIT
jgi:hypothetical protein